MSVKKLLIVDDSQTSRALFKACLNLLSEDYQLLAAGDWKEGLELAINEKPYVIVFDYNMPEKVGTELAKMIRDKGIESYFVLLTANTQSAIVQEAQDLGFIEVLEKPVTSDMILSVLEKIR